MECCVSYCSPMGRFLISFLSLFLAGLTSAYVTAAPPSTREATAAAQAAKEEARGDWLAAAKYWEQSMQEADGRGDYDRVIERGEKALVAWRHLATPMSFERQVFALGVMSKLDIEQGRLTRGRERNLAALKILSACIVETSGWRPEPGKPAPASVPGDLLEAWARAERDTATWLDAQGRTVEAVDLLTATEASVRAAMPNGRATGFYHRKLISTRAGMLKFLGFLERSLADLKLLEDTATPGLRESEWSRRFNLAYFSSQFYGPKPEYLDTVRAILREQEAVGRRNRDLRRLAAKMAYAYGETGANVADLEELIAEARAAGADLDAIYTQRDLAVIEAQRGKREKVEAMLLQSLEALRKRGVKRGEPTLYREYGVFLIGEGRFVEALQILKEAVRLTRSFGWTQHLPALLGNLADAQAKAGDVQGVTQTLAELDALIVSGKLVSHREFLARCTRAYLLKLLGRMAEAEAELGKATALADRLGFNEFQRSELEWARGAKPMEPTTGADAASASAVQNPTGIIDLQPVVVLATAEAGATAHARFRLSNATTQAASGTFTFAGRGLKVTWDATAGVASVTAFAEDGRNTMELPVRIESGEEIILKLESPVSEKGGVRIEWKGDGGTLTANCHLRTESGDGDLPGVTITNTSLAFANPFYALHLHHPVRVTAAAGKNFRVRPSERRRVEILDAHTGGLLAVDADGDGAFTSMGDSLGGDADADGYPDLPVDPATGRGEIEVLLFPLSGAAVPVRDNRIEIQARVGGGWKTIAHDVLKAPVQTAPKKRVIRAR
jgi:tetratricopeptide (TPR) repeat protein